MTHSPETTSDIAVTSRSPGRKQFWLGISVCLVGVILVAVQYGAGQLIVPWYSPILATIGAALLLWSFLRRKTVVRIFALVLVMLLAGFQWQFLLSASLLPEYSGTAQIGEKFPPFETKLADGTPFNNHDLETGTTTVLTFFRGRW